LTPEAPRRDARGAWRGPRRHACVAGRCVLSSLVALEHGACEGGEDDARLGDRLDDLEWLKPLHSTSSTGWETILGKIALKRLGLAKS
jgi:hypothetical protein